MQLLGGWIRSCLPPIEKHQPDPITEDHLPREPWEATFPVASSNSKAAWPFFIPPEVMGWRKGMMDFGHTLGMAFWYWEKILSYSSWNGILMQIVDFFCGGFMIFMLAGWDFGRALIFCQNFVMERWTIHCQRKNRRNQKVMPNRNRGGCSPEKIYLIHLTLKLKSWFAGAHPSLRESYEKVETSP